MPVSLGLGSLTEKKLAFGEKKAPSIRSIPFKNADQSCCHGVRGQPFSLHKQDLVRLYLPFVESDCLTTAKMDGQASLRLHTTYSLIWRLEVVNMIMQALVISVQRDRLLVLDFATRRRVIVITPDARRFRQGNIVRIRYNGVMTNSIPPQIFALNIFALPGGGPWCNRC